MSDIEIIPWNVNPDNSKLSGDDKHSIYRDDKSTTHRTQSGKGVVSRLIANHTKRPKARRTRGKGVWNNNFRDYLTR